MICNTIVIGAGIEGSATAFELVRNGVCNVVLLEQFERCHSRGSSCGQSRITRIAYRKPFYVPMMRDAFKMWSDLERSSEVQLFMQTGYLEYGPSGHGELKRTIDSLTTHNVSHNVFSGQEANKMYPHQLKLPPAHKCIYEDEGGILYAQRALLAFQQQFLKLGGRLLDNHKVIEIIPGDVVTVVTSKCMFKSKNVVIATGPWAPALCSSIGIQLPFKVVRVEVLYWKVDNPAAFSSDIFPTTFGYYRGQAFYGVPVEEFPDMIKVCTSSGVSVDPDARDAVTSPVSVSVVKDYITSTFRGVATQPSIIESCMYTISPDYDPVIDRHPHYDNIIIAAGFTGHGFKLSPVFGKLIAELVIGGSPSHDLSHFRIARFLTPTSHF